MLARELARVLPGSEYVPRGVKTVRKLSSLASSRGHAVAMIVESSAGKPKFLQFLGCSEGWRWGMKIELGGVELQRDLGQKIRLSGTKVVAGSPEAKELAKLLGELWGMQLVRKAGAEAFAVVDRDKIRFQRGPEKVGPVLHVLRVVGKHGRETG